MGKTERGKRNIPMQIAGILLCLTLVSAWLVSGMYARYTTSGTFSDTARVAKFNVTEAGTYTTSLTPVLVPGGSQTYDLIVTNNREVAIRCTIAIENVYENLPLTFSLSNKTGETTYSAPFDVDPSDGLTVSIAPNSSAQTFGITIGWPADQNDPALAEMVDLLIVTLTAEQLD